MTTHKPTWCIIDLDTNQPIRWHVDVRNLRQWAASMNVGEGRQRYVVTITEDQ